MIPHRGDVKYISSKYDRAIDGFFQFFRFVVAFSIMVCIVFLVLLAVHTIFFINDKLSFSSSPDLCYYIPCYFFYSRFDSKLDYIYSLTYLIFVIIGMVV